MHHAIGRTRFSPTAKAAGGRPEKPGNQPVPASAMVPAVHVFRAGSFPGTQAPGLTRFERIRRLSTQGCRWRKPFSRGVDAPFATVRRAGSARHRDSCSNSSRKMIQIIKESDWNHQGIYSQSRWTQSSVLPILTGVGASVRSRFSNTAQAIVRRTAWGLRES